MGPEVRGLVEEAARRLAAGGVPSPEVDAAELLAHVLGTGRARLAFAPEPTARQCAEYAALVRRRAAREPLQHLTGTVGFRHLDLAVGPGVFVPRPETELLAGWGAERTREVLARRPLGPAPVVVDLGTGSGAIALAVATEVPGSVVYAVELDRDALVWAERNLAGSGVTLCVGDLATACPELDGCVDVVLSNPPYIPLEAWESVAPEARSYDPAAALWAGPDGLDAIRSLEFTASRLLRVGGVVGVEHAEAQATSAPGAFTCAVGRWREVRDHPDLAGRARFLSATLAR